MSKRLLCISSGLLAPKKIDNPVARRHMYLNYGLLGLASILEKHGYEPFVTHGRFEDPTSFVRRLNSLGLIAEDIPVLFSLPSSFAIGWARETMASLRSLVPDLKIIVGGRWVVADDPNWIRGMLPHASTFIEGLAEGRIVEIVGKLSNKHSTDGTTSDLSPVLNYRLLEDTHLYQPSIEVSRGCGKGCSFCAEATVPLGAMKDPRQVADELDGYRQLIGNTDFHAYFETSFFRPSSNWISSFLSEMQNRSLLIPWRTESRVDAWNPKMVEQLRKTGMHVIDLGLESASPKQLLAMKKTPKPDVYLKKASELLKACYDEGIWAKVNVLLFPGETRSTLLETTDWLNENRDFIKGLSVGPTILYRYGQATHSVKSEFESLGATVVEEEALDRDGYAHLHLSSEVDHDFATQFSSDLAREYMTARDYYDLKAFSYLPRDYSWDDFKKEICRVPPDRLPFRLEGIFEIATHQN